jgi:hypothetical protein
MIFATSSVFLCASMMLLTFASKLWERRTEEAQQHKRAQTERFSARLEFSPSLPRPTGREGPRAQIRPSSREEEDNLFASNFSGYILVKCLQMSEVHDDQYSGMRPINSPASRMDSFKCDLTLKQIQKELKKLTDMAHQGIGIDESRFDYLLRAQEHNEEYKLQVAEERAAWRDSVYDFAEQCLERTRSFVPLNIFESTQESLIAIGLSPELAKRVLQRQCLWLTRMSKTEIATVHESDLVGRFNSSAQLMDIIETAAIYIALPDKFNADESGRKAEWRDNVEENLRRMLQDNDNGQLPEGRIRHPAYNGLQFGPIEDVTSVRETNIVSGRHSHRPRRSFLEVCKQHSILSSAANVKADPVLDSSDSDRESFQDEYEEDGDAAEEEVYVVEGTSEDISAGITFQKATSYVTRDFVDESFDEGEDQEGASQEEDEDDGQEEAAAEGEEDVDSESEGEGAVAPVGVDADVAEAPETAAEADTQVESGAGEEENQEGGDRASYSSSQSSYTSQSSDSESEAESGFAVVPDNGAAGGDGAVVEEAIAAQIEELALAERIRDRAEYFIVERATASMDPYDDVARDEEVDQLAGLQDS